MRITRRKVYDVCVIGSGAAGGFMANELAGAGARTVLLEAGRKVELDELHIHDWPYELPRRGFGMNRQAALYPDDMWKSVEYRCKDWIGVDRIRTLGGRTVHWNAVCLRFSADDFRERTVSGVEEDWPVSYRELAPFYSYAERVMGVCGTREGLDALPDGDFVAAPPRLRCSEHIAGRACEKLGMRLIPTRKALLTKPAGGRAPCHYCGHCMDVCDVGAIFTSTNTLIPPALATGNLTLRTNALAKRVLVDREGRASGVLVVDRVTKREEEVYAKVVVVSCGAIESARLLLNSACDEHPNGLANSNDAVGRYLHGHTSQGRIGYLKDLVGTPPVDNDGAMDHGLIPRSNYGRAPREYAGGFQIQTQFYSFMYPHHARGVPGFGAGYKKRVRDLQPAMLQMGAFGKVLARRENRVTVDPAKVDTFGIPIPIVQVEFCDNDRAVFKDMMTAVEEINHTAGVELFLKAEPRIGGFASHEVGTCRMGIDPKTSVLNSYCQAREVPNLFVVDGSCFTTMPEKNPTLTIAALAVRSARYIARQRKKGAL